MDSAFSRMWQRITLSSFRFVYKRCLRENGWHLSILDTGFNRKKVGHQFTTAGCDEMTCGAHAHGQAQHGEGCGLTFLWSQAPRYQARVAEQRQPPGFSAILAWVQQYLDGFRCVPETKRFAIGKRDSK